MAIQSSKNQRLKTLLSPLKQKAVIFIYLLHALTTYTTNKSLVTSCSCFKCSQKIRLTGLKSKIEKGSNRRMNRCHAAAGHVGPDCQPTGEPSYADKAPWTARDRRQPTAIRVKCVHGMRYARYLRAGLDARISIVSAGGFKDRDVVYKHKWDDQTTRQRSS